MGYPYINVLKSQKISKIFFFLIQIIKPGPLSKYDMVNTYMYSVYWQLTSIFYMYG